MRGRIIGRTRTGRTSRDGKRFGAEGGKRGMGGGVFPESPCATGFEWFLTA